MTGMLPAGKPARNDTEIEPGTERNRVMLIPQQAQCDSGGVQGRRRTSFAELRSEVASPSRISDGVRQRLLELAARLARVQGLGDEYSRVDFSRQAAAALRDVVEAA